MDTGIRKRVEPSWYGNRGELSDSISSDSESLYADNSFDDKNYTPEKNQREIGNSNTELNPNKDMNICPQISPSQEAIAQDNIVITVDAREKCASTPNAENPKTNLEIINLNDEIAEICRNKSTSHEINLNNDDSIDTTRKRSISRSNDEIDVQLLIGLQKNSIEILTRISKIEDCLRKGGFFNTMKMENVPDRTHGMAFMESNNLPLNSMESIDLFETRLEKEAFKKTAIEHILNSPEIQNTVHDNQAALLKIVVKIIFVPHFLAKFTWSGKSKNQRKIPLKTYEKLVDLMYAVANQCFGLNYQYAVFLNHLKNKIIKHAYKFEQSESTINRESAASQHSHYIGDDSANPSKR